MCRCLRTYVTSVHGELISAVVNDAVAMTTGSRLVVIIIIIIITASTLRGYTCCCNDVTNYAELLTVYTVYLEILCLVAGNSITRMMLLRTSVRQIRVAKRSM